MTTDPGRQVKVIFAGATLTSVQVGSPTEHIRIEIKTWLDVEGRGAQGMCFVTLGTGQNIASGHTFQAAVFNNSRLSIDKAQLAPLAVDYVARLVGPSATLYPLDRDTPMIFKNQQAGHRREYSYPLGKGADRLESPDPLHSARRIRPSEG